ncbi:reverse transcriptase domain-containing protein [Tanacetum coccineum]
MAPKRATRSNIALETTNTTSVTNAQLQAMINQGVTAALAARDADRNTNGDDSHISGAGFERMESVFHISNCTVENQVKFATCTLHSVALTWWNTHVKTVGHDAAYGMPWKTLMKMMTDKYCPRNEIKKLEMEIWDLKVMAASTIPVSAEENLGDPIDIRVDIIHPEPVAAVAFPAAAVVRTQAQHGEAIRGIQEHLLGVPIQEELTALRFRADIAEAENASLRARIKTTEAIEKITRNRERQARVKIEQQLAAVQESQRQDREDFRKLKELVTSQFGRHS